jgi:hypothetical protein
LLNYPRIRSHQEVKMLEQANVVSHVLSYFSRTELVEHLLFVVVYGSHEYPAS